MRRLAWLALAAASSSLDQKALQELIEKASTTITGRDVLPVALDEAVVFCLAQLIFDAEQRPRGARFE
ncbi:exported hypothetical protein [Candidatus Accumulibacter aalborgensis]|uniref:Uncharacterized protein n=1 Tax=Candidatus Accumulibacter aalborgensis TaxID=1860102 RepID=A0A1A8XSK9_9PROT|nr:exported hypothetical protein [Candidatus Accumulibacter aalborgensis]